jgi:hypothetical protein
LLTINPKGKIRKLYTPFRVFSNENKSWLYVEKVRQGYNDKIIYIINGNAYFHSSFELRIDFYGFYIYEKGKVRKGWMIKEIIVKIKQLQ